MPGFDPIRCNLFLVGLFFLRVIASVRPLCFILSGVLRFKRVGPVIMFVGGLRFGLSGFLPVFFGFAPRRPGLLLLVEGKIFIFRSGLEFRLTDRL